MWAILNRTPYAAERTFLRGPDGHELWVVAVKATFTITLDGGHHLSAVQKPVLRVPRLAEIGGAPLLLEDADLGPPKPATDVIVSGHAHAPGGRAVPELVVSMVVGPIKKSLLVVGDRVWEGRHRPSLSAAQPFVRMPLTYERAYGGLDPDSKPPVRDRRNPVGRGFVVGAADAAGRMAPNVELPEMRITRVDQRPPPAGFAPIAASWSPRVDLAGTYDSAWREDRLPLPPRDAQAVFHCAAPADQQVAGHLRGGEQVILRNLTPQGEWSFALPRVALGFETHFDDGAQRHGAVLSTVEIRPDDREVTMSFVSHLPCHRRDHRLTGTVVTQKAIVPLGTSGKFA
jgi:hypothetical protein